MAHLSTTGAHSVSLGERLSTTFADFRERWVQYRLYRKTLNELSDLSARELNDLGISRANLRSVAYQSVYKD